MANKVNKKFVIIITAAIVVLASVVATLAWQVISKSGEDYVKMADRELERGDFREAARLYSRAVAKDRTNIAWVEKWRDALVQSIPPTDTEYRQAYIRHYVGMILTHLAATQPRNPQAQHDYIGEMYERYRLFNPDGRAWGDLAEITTRALEMLDPDDVETQKLRRYRGFALLNQSRSISLAPDMVRTGVEDLRAAVKADPQDMEARLALVEWIAADASRVYGAGRHEESARLWAEAFAQADAVIAEFPGDPRPMLRRIEVELSRIQVESINTAEMRVAASRLEPRLNTVYQAALAYDPDKMSGRFLERLVRVGGQIAPAKTAEELLRVTDRMLASNPENIHAMWVRALALTQLGRIPESNEMFERVARLPDRPVSLEGLWMRNLRIQALRRRAEQALAIWEVSTPDEKPAVLARVREFRNELAASAGAESPELLRVDALLAYADERYSEAVRLFTELNVQTGGSDEEALFFLANALRRSGNLGAAMEQLERITSSSPSNVQARLVAAEIELSRRDLPAALRWLNQALEADPGNEYIRERVDAINAIAERDRTGGLPEDPVLAAIQQSRRLRTPERFDIARATEIIDNAMRQHPDDVRLILERAMVDVQRGEPDVARNRVNEALVRFPQNQNLRTAKFQLEISDPVERQLAMIDSSDASPVEKAIQRAGVLVAAGREADAQPFIHQAAAVEPTNPAVIELQFATAMRANDMVKAREIASRAAAANTDQANGLLYQGRIELHENKFEAAAATLDRAVQRAEFNPIAWRLLGQAQLGVGRVNAAIDSFKRAFDIRPDDPGVLGPYLAALASVDREAEGLEVARRAVQLNQADQPIAEMWLELEERYGDVNAALTARRRLHMVAPENLQNNVAMIRTLLRLGQWEEARRVLDSLPKSGPNALATFALDARWHAMQGNFDAGRQLFESYVSAVEPADVGRAQLAYAEFLIENGRNDDARVVLESAREHQSKELMEADRRLGDIYFHKGEWEQAIETYTRVINAGIDANNTVAKRRAEVYLRMQRWDDVARTVGEIEKTSGRDLQTLMLLAEAAYGKGDTRTTRQLVDAAVALAPTDPLPFLRRARLNMNDDDQFVAVMQDLDQALRLRPGLMDARRMRVDLFRQHGRITDAIAELRATIDARPDDDNLRVFYIGLLQESGRTDDAKVAAAQAVERRGAQEPAWFQLAGEVFVRAGDHRGAVPYYQRLYDSLKSTQALIVLIDTMLIAQPPLTAQAQRALEAHKAGADPMERLMMLCLSARVHGAAGRPDQSERALREAWAIAREAPAPTRFWFEHAGRVFGGDNARFITFIESMERREVINPAARVLLARLMLRDRSRWTEALQALAGVEVQTNDHDTLVELFRIRGQIYYVLERYQDAVNSFRAGVMLMPQDAEFNNNVAYTLASHLNDPSGALPFAERAVELDPGNANALDTLGWIHHRLGRNDQAERTLTRALRLAKVPAETLATNIHLAAVKLELGDRASAREHYTAARRIASGDDAIAAPYASLFESLRSRLGIAD